MFGSRGEVLLWLSYIVATLVGVATVLLLRAFSSMPPLGAFAVAIVAAFIGWVVFGLILTKTGL